MPVILTGRNHVVVGRPSTTDTVVVTVFRTPTAARRWVIVQPIEKMGEAVAFARSMAEYMDSPVSVLPYESEDAVDYEELTANAHELACAGQIPEVREQGRALALSLRDWTDIRESAQ